MKKSFIISSLTALAALCLCVTAQAQGPIVVSDKDDYSPGETAMFSTTGFQPTELLDFSVAVGGDDGTWVPDIAWTDIPADASGNAEVDYVVPESWAGKSLQLTVMGLSSGLLATTTFTDTVSSAVINSPTTGSPVHVTTAGGPITANITYTSGGMGNTQVHFLVDATPTDQYNNQADNGTNVNYTVHVPASLTTGCHNLTLQVVRSGSLMTTQTCAIIVDAPSPTPTPTATPSGTPCLNTPPVITCTGNDADLGQVVGCLGVGTGFGQTFPVSYAVVNGSGNSKIVQATFTKPDSTTVTIDVANVTDTDGDTITVTLSNGTNPVTISGPGSGSASFTVDIHADDGQTCNNTADHTCGGNANARIVYGFNGFFPPLSNVATTKVKQGSAVPVKFQLTDCSGTLITPANMPGDGSAPMVNVVYVSGAAPQGEPTVDDAGNSNGDTDFARWDPTGLQWIFNLKTNTTYYVGNTYGIQVLPNDGTTHTANISIK